VAKTVIENPRKAGEMIETISIEEATKKLREIAGYDVAIKPAAAKKNDDNKHDKEREKKEQEIAIENAFRRRLFDTLHTRIEADMLDQKSKTWPILYRMVAHELMQLADLSFEDQKILISKYIPVPAAEAGKEIDWESYCDEFEHRLHEFTPAQHLMLIVELTLISQELYTTWTGKPVTMLKIANEIGIDADGLRKEATAEHKASIAAAKKAEKATAKPASKAASAKKQPEAAATPATPLSEPQKPKIRPAATWPFPTPGKIDGDAA
jgi:hypothetical protein